MFYYYVMVGTHYLAQDMKFYARPTFPWFTSSKDVALDTARVYDGHVSTQRP